MNHKRRRPKNRRAGCLLCKPGKANGARAAIKHPIAAQRQMGSAGGVQHVPDVREDAYESGTCGACFPEHEIDDETLEALWDMDHEPLRVPMIDMMRLT